MREKAEAESDAHAREGLGAGDGECVEQRQRLLRLLLAGKAISLDMVQFSYSKQRSLAPHCRCYAFIDEFSAN